MPKRVERAITREYEQRGYSKKRARAIAFATMVKRGIWRPGKRRGKRRRGER